MDRSKIMIIGGILILLFDLVYNMLHKPISIGYISRTAIAFGFCCILFGVAQDKIITIFRTIGKLFESRTYHVLFIILVISLLIRLLFLPERWINPDEGAHLYDAKFILEGKVPFVDYVSRMPVYVYILAVFQKVFGYSYMAGRLLPLFSNIGIGILVFLIGNKLFNNKKIALLASAIYLFSPLSILWSVVVKTELPETLFVCIGMFLLLSYIKSEKEKYSIIFLSGVFFALAYYVRQSAIAIFLASLLIVLYFYKDDLIKLFKTYSAMLLGYLSVIFIIVMFFSSFMGFTATWQSSLNPLDTVVDPIQKITGTLSKTTNSESLGSFHQPHTQTISEWKMVLKLNSFLVIGIFLFFLILLHNFMGKKYNGMFEENKTSFIFLLLWVIPVCLFYIYYSIRTSFFTPYFGEVLPALVLILSYGIIFFASEMRSHRRLKKNIGLFCIIVIALYMSSISLVNTSFECVWSPETVQEVSEYVKLHSDEKDVVLSGAMVWTLETNTRPFMNETHPLRFLRGMSDDQIKEIEYQMEHNKPKFIVLDGYTEKIYLKHVTTIQGEINESYILKKEVYGSIYPVKVYELR